MPSLWDKEVEKEFFEQALKLTTKEKLFYKTADGKYLAYWPAKYDGKKDTLQSRNTFIGNFTERWVVCLLKSYAESKGFFALQGVVCEELELPKKSSADVAFCRTNDTHQRAENIVALFEVKMSIVWNWEYKNNSLLLVGDYSTHCGNPGMLRSDSMLKAIGKSIGIRVSGKKASTIPIIVIGNTPITEHYINKVDHLKESGVIQGFWSVNSNPTNNTRSIKNTSNNGFIRMDSYDELLRHLNQLLNTQLSYVSFMKSKKELGSIIEIANREISLEEKGEKFLQLIRD